MAAIIGGGPRRPPRIMRKNIILKSVRKGVRDDEGEKIKREGYEVQSGVLTMSQNHSSTFKPRQLPGIANDVESYPCRFCEEKIFLTASGLEKHGREAHPQNIEDIVTDINIICSEWKKREFERLRSRERFTMDKLRHEARAHQLVKAVLSKNNPSAPGGEQYEACTICNMLVNIAHPTAMESHQKAHKKNDELRLQLIDQYGPEAVQRLTCDACSLVFPDNEKLKVHVSSHHTRRKKYICKFCGHISQSMSELNLHKNDVHNYSAWTNAPNYMKARRTFYQYDERQKRMRRRSSLGINDEIRQPMLGEISEGDTAGKVTCSECGLKLNRPRLLFKHMERVHMKSSFACMVETGGLPTFGMEVSNGEILWTCCDSKFDNRPDFIDHRRLHIPTQHEEVIVENSEDPHDVPSTSQAMVEVQEGAVHDAGEPQNFPQFVQDEDGNVIQVFIPDGYDPRETFYFYDESGTKLQLVPVQNTEGEEDQTLQPSYIVSPVDQEEGDQLIGEEDNMIEMEGEEGVGEEGVQENEYVQFQMDLGNEWTNMGSMQMILVNGGEVIEEEHTEDVNNHTINHHHEIVEEDDDPVVHINGQPLFE